MSDSTVTLSFSESLRAALSARNAEVFSKDTVTAINNLDRCKVGIDKTMSEPCFAEVAPELIRRARIADHRSNKRDFIAVKVLVKLISTMQALASGLKSDLDPYTQTIGQNLCNNLEMTNKSNYVCLSKSVEYSALDRTQPLRAKRDCSVGTASTQASSTRMTLHYLGIVDATKDRDSDTMKLSDNERSKRFVTIFKKK